MSFKIVLVMSLQFLNCQQCLGQVVYDALSNKCQLNGWTIKNFCCLSVGTYCHYCDSDAIFGKYHSNTSLQKSYSLPPHFKISVSAYFWSSTWVTTPSLYVVADNYLLFKTSFGPVLTSTNCSSVKKANFIQTVNHTSNRLTIYIYGEDYYWGILDYQLSIYQCNKECKWLCDNDGTCQNQINYVLIYDLDLNSGYPIEGWIKNEAVFTTKYQEQSLFLLGQFNLGDVIKKQIIIEKPSWLFIQLKVITVQIVYYKIAIFIGQELIMSDISSGQLILKSCNDLHYTNNLFKTQKTLQLINNFTIKVLLYNASTTCSNPTFGISDFFIFKIENGLEYYDQNLFPFDGCFFQSFQCVEGCSFCLNGQCLDCENGWLFNFVDQTCIPQCGDGKIQQLEECDDGNLIEFDGCFKCKFSCKQFCQNCKFGICLDQVDDSYNFFDQPIMLIENSIGTQHFIQKSVDNCFDLFFNKCKKCKDGYILNFNKDQCIPKCNDGISIGSEKCDDLNNIQFDGCYHCENNCQIQCLVCDNTHCLACGNGYSLVNNQCIAICGDGIIALGSDEQCEDQNYNAGDGCYNCKIECSQNCCEEYYELSLNNSKCLPICGDGYVVQGLEECEDFNEIPYDGCYQCQFQCRKGCQNCKEGNCQDQCDYGYYFINDVCQSVCGDKIIASNEECDDGNNVNFDGCYNCLSSCTDSCLDCSLGFCFQCQSGYILENNQCLDVCGNGRKVSTEDCDDGNTVNNDGCSKLCLKENGWDCLSIENSKSECELKPTFLLTYLNQTSELQYVQLSFSKSVKIDTNSKKLIEQLTYQLKEVQQEIYKINIEFIEEISNIEFRDAAYLITVVLFKSLQDPILEVTLTSSIYDNSNFYLQIPQKEELLLKSATIMNKAQISQALQFQTFGENLIIGLLVSSVLILIFGKSYQDFFEILDQLQYQSYLRYINIQFPQNLLIYFESSDKITISPILNFLNINSAFNVAIQEEFKESYGKFKFYSLNADLLSNIYGQILQFCIFVFILFFLTCYKKFYYKNCFSNRIFYEVKKSKSKILEKLAITFYNINKNIFYFQKLTNLEGFYKLALANSWDLLFKIFLFFESLQNSNQRELVSYFISIFYLSFLTFYLITHFKRQNQKIVLQTLRERQHEAVILVKKVLFLGALIGLQREPILQCLILASIIIFYLGFILTIRFIESNFNLKILLWNEIPILIFTLVCLFFNTNLITYFTGEKQILLGFAQISILLFGLFASFYRHGVTLALKLNNLFVKFCKKPIRPEILDPNKIFTMKQK